MTYGTIRRLATAIAALWLTTGVAGAQNLGTFKWQTLPFCNVLTLTVIQQGAGFQIVGSDDLCGGGPAPVNGTAVLAAGGVNFGVEVVLPSGRATHLSATVSLGTLSGTWSDDDVNSGTFQFTTASSGGATRPLSAAAAAIRLESTVTLGTQGSASPLGISTMTAGVATRGLAGRAPRNCTLTGTATVSGTVTAGQVILTHVLLDANGAQISGTRSDLLYTPAVASNTTRAFPVRSVLAGQLVLLGEVNFAGLAFSTTPVAYIVLICT